MSQEAMKRVGETEETVRQMRREAEAQAQQAIEAAVQTGEAKVAEAVRRAEAECVQMMQEAEQASAKGAVALASNTENKKAAIRARAESAMPAAVDRIVERIVRG